MTIKPVDWDAIQCHSPGEYLKSCYYVIFLQVNYGVQL